MSWYQRLSNVLRPGRMQRDLERELSFHIAERAEELQAGGMSAVEAWNLRPAPVRQLHLAGREHARSGHQRVARLLRA